MRLSADRIARQAAAWFAHPAAIGLFPFACWAWFGCGGSELGLTLLLSVLAISTTQLVLLAQEHDTRALHAKLDGLIRGVPDADDTLAGMEQD